MQGVKLTVDDLPDEIYVDGNEFKFLCCTIHSQKHFRSIFYIDKKLYLIDDLDNRNVNKRIPSHSFQTAFYYLAEK